MKLADQTGGKVLDAMEPFLAALLCGNTPDREGTGRLIRDAIAQAIMADRDRNDAARAIISERKRCAEIARRLEWKPAKASANNQVISKITADWGGKIAEAISRGEEPDGPAKGGAQ